jgi:hypothetical protein
MSTSRVFHVIWKQTGDLLEAWPIKGGYGFCYPGTPSPFRSMPEDMFWRTFRRVDEPPGPGEPPAEVIQPEAQRSRQAERTGQLQLF